MKNFLFVFLDRSFLKVFNAKLHLFHTRSLKCLDIWTQSPNIKSKVISLMLWDPWKVHHFSSKPEVGGGNGQVSKIHSPHHCLRSQELRSWPQRWRPTHTLGVWHGTWALRFFVGEQITRSSTTIIRTNTKCLLWAKHTYWMPRNPLNNRMRLSSKLMIQRLAATNRSFFARFNTSNPGKSANLKGKKRTWLQTH